MNSFISKIGWIVILTACIIPLYLWTIMMPFSARIATPGMTATSLGQLTGIVGLVLFSLSLALSVRISFIEQIFGGMNRVYLVHHQIGGISFLFLLFHPLFLAYTYLQSSPKAAALFLLPGDDWALNFGISSLLFLMALLILTYYIDLPYQFWRLTHKFLGFALLLGGIHSLLISSDVSRNPALQWYLLGVVMVGLVAFVYRTILGRWLVHRIPYTIAGVNNVAKDIFELILTPSTVESLSFVPGQFVFITFGSKGGNETHPFSISSAPNAKTFILTVKSLGDFTNTLPSLAANTPVWIEGPFGRFSYEYHTKGQYIWIAGGIGITPFVSMMRSLAVKEVKIDLYYCVKDDAEAAYGQELQTYAQSNPNLVVHIWKSKSQGRLKGELIAQLTPDFLNRDIFLCGPPAMMYALKKQLTKIGVKKSHIISEEFAML